MTAKLGNTSHAVMQQRHEAHDSLDDFPTPSWAGRALCEHVLKAEGLGPEDVIWEPACNRGYLVKGLRDYCGRVRCTDIEDYGWPGMEARLDFLFPTPPGIGADWIVTNPPFRLAAQFAARCRELRPHKGYALLVRVAFLEGQERYETLFRDHPPSIVAQFTERVPMVKGRYDPAASTATAYCWLVWSGGRDTRLQWIPPCRKQLERAGDA